MGRRHLRAQGCVTVCQPCLSGAKAFRKPGRWQLWLSLDHRPGRVCVPKPVTAPWASPAERDRNRQRRETPTHRAHHPSHQSHGHIRQSSCLLQIYTQCLSLTSSVSHRLWPSPPPPPKPSLLPLLWGLQPGCQSKIPHLQFHVLKQIRPEQSDADVT